MTKGSGHEIVRALETHSKAVGIIYNWSLDAKVT
jgi:hypothetical protein